MKIYRRHLLMLMFALLVPLKGMNVAASSRVATPETWFDSFKEYIDSAEYALAVKKIFEQRERTTLSIIKAIIPAIKIGRFPLIVTDNRKARLEEFFNPEELTKIISRLVEYSFKGTLRPRHIANLLEDLQGAMKMDRVESEFGQNPLIKYDAVISTLRASLDQDHRDDIPDIINFQGLPEPYRSTLESFFIIPRLNNALNSALRGASITLTVCLDCFDIRQIANNMGYAEMDPDGIREALELSIDFMNGNRPQMQQFFVALAALRENRRQTNLRGRRQINSSQQSGSMGADE